MKTYQLGDRLTLPETEALGLECGTMVHIWGESAKDGVYARCVRTGEFRAPKAGEWYLSGAIPVGYRAPNDLTTEYHILRLAAVEKRTVTTERRI